ncbi:MAG: nucleotidyltransferase [Deltaproteobacteria bacterium]|nr:nucleotidyltransferase [Deltaproteobacteria bacterium]
MTEADVIKEVARRLDGAGIGYMITGSVAANFYSIPRMTRDVDIVVELSEKDARRVFELFKEDFYADMDAMASAVKERGMFNVIHLEAVVKIDFIVRKDDPYRIGEFDRKRRILFEGAPLYVVSPEDLILSKLFWARETESEMQMNDVKNLMKSVKVLDYEYLEKWAGIIGVREAYEMVRS